jgi:hypothetical protein
MTSKFLDETELGYLQVASLTSWAVEEILTTETGEIVSRFTYYRHNEDSALELANQIHERNDKMGLRNGQTYLVKVTEPRQTA